jgi:hypothetical protein
MDLAFYVLRGDATGRTYVSQLVFTETVANLAAVCVDFLVVATFLAQAIIPIKSDLQIMDSSYRHKLHQVLKFGVHFTICLFCNLTSLLCKGHIE